MIISIFLFYPIALEGRRAPQMSSQKSLSAALVELTKSIPAHSLILSSHLFFCLHLFSLHQCASRADFSLTEQSLSKLFMTVWLALVMNRERGKPRKQTALFQKVSYPSGGAKLTTPLNFTGWRPVVAVFITLLYLVTEILYLVIL